MAGLDIFWILAPIYCVNPFRGEYVLMSSQGPRLEGTFNSTAYPKLRPTVFFSFATSYGLSFAAITANLVHSVLLREADLSTGFTEQLDILPRFMCRYAQVPEWWYGFNLIVLFVFALFI